MQVIYLNTQFGSHRIMLIQLL